MKTKTSELEGAALNWAVAKCEGCSYTYEITTGGDYNGNTTYGNTRSYAYSWAQGGPIIEREDCWPTRYYGAAAHRGKVYQASLGAGTYSQGPTPLIAAMRCYVASKLGAEVEIPEELT